ncbi:MAG: hypothetical protein O2955_06775 [Planctomycetota bacterium]|nr:hypothetical protein [Planctomycetota bacterium]MDA1212199.1 hypothetical protein [Planctomycetota bacterium]
MPALSTKRRCHNCGFRLRDDIAENCPNCYSHLAQVGVWSELYEWGITRQKGRAHFIWGASIFNTAVTSVGAILAMYFSKGILWWLVAILASSTFVSSYLIQRRQWRLAESENMVAINEGVVHSSR